MIMRNGTLWFGFSLGSLLIAGCSTPAAGEAARDFELYYEDGGLESVEFDPDTGASASRTSAVDRKRLGTRFAFGGEQTRGFFQVFTEEWNDRYSGKASLDGGGVGGGVKGAPKVGNADSEVAFLIPFRIDSSLVVGTNDSNAADSTLVYFDFHAELGFGVEWKGLRPSTGLAYSSLVGLEATKTVDYSLTGTNFGYFIDLQYQVEGSPLFAHVRALMGDYNSTTFGIGVKF